MTSGTTDAALNHPSDTTIIADFGPGNEIIFQSLTSTAGTSFQDSYDTNTNILIVTEITPAGLSAASATIEVLGDPNQPALTTGSFLNINGPTGETIVTNNDPLNTTSPIDLDYGATAILTNTESIDNIPIIFGANIGPSGNLNTLEIDGAVATTNIPYTGAITGFGTNDIIIIGPSTIPSFQSPTDTVTLTYSHNLLSITELTATGSFLASTTLDITGTYNTNNFQATSTSSGIDINTIPCFASRTLILTPTGNTPIEQLKKGDEVLTARDNTAQKIIWTGQRTINISRHTNPDIITPVRILAGAFSPGLPERDLVLSPDHCLFINNHLIEAKTLTNGATIIRNHNSQTITYHHIELEQHDVVLAEGLPAETYLDTGNRGNFAGNTNTTTLHPNFTPTHRTGSCAPLLADGPLIRTIRQQLLDRAISLGFHPTGHLDLIVKAGTKHITGTKIATGALQFPLPAGITTLSLISTTGIPAELSANPNDRRTLGVSITGLAIVTNTERFEIPVNDSNHTGFHPPENGYRWTNGNAQISLPKIPNNALLEVSLMGQAVRWQPSPGLARK